MLKENDIVIFKEKKQGNQYETEMRLGFYASNGRIYYTRKNEYNNPESHIAEVIIPLDKLNPSTLNYDEKDNYGYNFYESCYSIFIDDRINRKDVIDTINIFINKFQHYKEYPKDNPEYGKLHLDYVLEKYAKENELTPLYSDYYLEDFPKKVRSDGGWYHNNRNDACVMSDKNGIKHLILIRNFSEPFELSLDTKMVNDTLIEIFKLFVIRGDEFNHTNR